MRISLRDPHFSKSARHIVCDWGQLVDFYLAEAKTIRGTTKEDQPGIAFHHTQGGWHDAEVDPVGFWAIALDFDDTPDDAFRRAVEACQGVSNDGLAHTTWSHGTGPEGTTRGRIVLPFDEPVEPHQWSNVWSGFERLMASVGATIDPSCKSLSRFYYLPSINRAALAPFDQTVWMTVWGQ